MNIKKNLILAIATGFVGMALISGGTVAYFSSQGVAGGAFTSGTLKLELKDEKRKQVVNEKKLFDFKDIKPGDVFDYTFYITNSGTLDMKDVVLTTDYVIRDENNKKVKNDFGKQIIIKQITVNGEKLISNKNEISLDRLNDLKLEKRKNPKQGIILAESLAAKKGDRQAEELKVTVEFEFKNSPEDQNQFQGHQLELIWTIAASQKDD